MIKHVGIHADKLDSKLNSFEEGKSKFLPFMTSFNSENDAFRLLDWINEHLEDLRLFIKEDLNSCDDLDKQDAENEAHTKDLNHTDLKNDGLWTSIILFQGTNSYHLISSVVFINSILERHILVVLSHQSTRTNLL